jgi:UPF0271 protein
MQEYIDINSDVGESFGAYKIGEDEKVFKYITSANIACGFHGGDPCVMRHTVGLAKRLGVGVGVHPGLPDLLGFGRRKMDVTPQEAADYTTYQIGALQAFAKAAGMSCGHIKFHGSFFTALVAKDKKLADAVVEAILKVNKDLILVSRPGTLLDESARRFGLRYAPEWAVDRARHSDGEPVSRREPNAVTTDPLGVADRVEMIMKEGKMKAVDGKDINIGPFSSFCIHGDNPNALEILNAVRAKLDEIGVNVRPLKEFFD